MKKKRKEVTRVSRNRLMTTDEATAYRKMREVDERDMPPKPVSLARKILARLRNAREDAGISLSELEQRTGIAKSNLSRLEKSGDNATLETLERYADAVGCALVIDVKKSVAVKKKRPVAG